MKGLTFQGIETVEFQSDLLDPVIVDPTDVIVRVLKAGICGSDLHQYHGRESVRPGTIPGHEFAGEIVAAGRSVQNFKVGDRVFAPFTTSCGECFFCNNRLSSRCNSGQLFGYLPPADEVDEGRGIQGAQAELIRVPAADPTLLHLEDGISLEAAVLLGDNFTTGFFCADMANVQRDGLTVVIGCGSVGLCAIVGAKSLGAENIVAIDFVADRQRRAAALGATVCSPENAVEVVNEISHQLQRPGADSVLEAVGIPSAQDLAFQLVRPGGTISAIGVHTANTFTFSPGDAYDKNITYRAGRCPVRSYLGTLVRRVQDGELVIPVDQIITHDNLAFEDGPSAYKQFSERRDNCVKVLLSPT
jgi:2-desacetyl-2-hydroxyethyl bacteriochlorophyllide A dehydrogenase